MTHYKLTLENGGSHLVFAETEEEATEAYYESIKSIIGHQLRICGCFGPEQPLDRSKITGIVSMIKLNKDL